MLIGVLSPKTYVVPMLCICPGSPPVKGVIASGRSSSFWLTVDMTEVADEGSPLVG